MYNIFAILFTVIPELKSENMKIKWTLTSQTYILNTKMLFFSGFIFISGLNLKSFFKHPDSLFSYSETIELT